MKHKNKMVFASEFSCKESSGLDDTVEGLEIPDIKLCDYVGKCNITCPRDTKKYENCRVRKFYGKYKKWEKQH